jgi:hypothetical protein
MSSGQSSGLSLYSPRQAGPFNGQDRNRRDLENPGRPGSDQSTKFSGWMEEGFFALGLDSKGEPIRAVASNPGHCIATGIVDEVLLKELEIDSLLMTCSAAGAFGRYRPKIRHLTRTVIIADLSGQLSTARSRSASCDLDYGITCTGCARHCSKRLSVFDFYRLPEVFCGHARDDAHPFPALYPKTNWPQAWSASAMFSLLQATLGIYPSAPLNALIVDPHLPQMATRDHA